MLSDSGINTVRLSETERFLTMARQKIQTLEKQVSNLSLDLYEERKSKDYWKSLALYLRTKIDNAK